mmetsp:Transcript_21980/g.36024  ORF Transcript_21980/g.36024 Transcript_21980/m.36024 type:complete len:93 (+) Transcript_21980:112-390(+)
MFDIMKEYSVRSKWIWRIIHSYGLLYAPLTILLGLPVKVELIDFHGSVICVSKIGYTWQLSVVFALMYDSGINFACAYLLVTPLLHIAGKAK